MGSFERKKKKELDDLLNNDEKQFESCNKESQNQASTLQNLPQSNTTKS